MSFKSVLILDDKKSQSYEDPNSIKILSCEYGFSQSIDHSFKPNERPKGGLITLVIESTNDTNFIEWMVSPTHVKSGRIVFLKRDGLGVMRDVRFIDAFCVNFVERYKSTNAEPLQTTITLSARILELGQAKHENAWPLN